MDVAVGAAAAPRQDHPDNKWRTTATTTSRLLTVGAMQTSAAVGGPRSLSARANLAKSTWRQRSPPMAYCALLINRTQRRLEDILIKPAARCQPLLACPLLRHRPMYLDVSVAFLRVKHEVRHSRQGMIHALLALTTMLTLVLPDLN